MKRGLSQQTSQLTGELGRFEHYPCVGAGTGKQVSVAEDFRDS